jgi:hypothetical protein
MIQLLLVVCCVFACPALMGGIMWFMSRDHQAAKLEREVRRLNAAAARRRLLLPASTLDDGASQHAAASSTDAPTPVGKETTTRAAN